MKSDMVGIVVRLLLLFTTLAAAGSWQPLENIRAALVGRQDSETSNSAAASTAAASASSGSRASITAKPTSDAASASASASASETAAASATGSATGTKTTTGKSGSSKSSSKAAATTAFDPRLPAGGISMVDPAATDSTSYYKIGDYVTFKWNYTSLSVTPSAVDVMASCSANAELYTIALNQSADEPSVTWDTGKFATGTAPLLTESYTLIVYDAGSSISATPRAGYLGTASQYIFAMYSPQAYTPLNEFKCATCSGALSDMERHALGFTLGMACITLLSFTWFAGGIGALL